jgi:hypothetical protein
LNSPFNKAKYEALLEGLEVSEVLFSELISDNEKFRFDDEFFMRKYINAYRIIMHRLTDYFGFDGELRGGGNNYKLGTVYRRCGRLRFKRNLQYH